MTQNQPASIPAKIKSVLTRDPKKSLALTVLFTVLIVLWARMMTNGGKTTPRAAGAMTHMPTLPTVEPPVHPSASNGQGQVLLRGWLDQPLPTTVSRNLFETRLDYFPTDGSRAAAGSRTAEQATFWDELAKSIDAQADQQHKREILIQNLRQQAGQLQLTSTVTGPNPKAVINGVMVGEGEVVAQFRVIKIEARSAVIEREGIRLEIALK